MRRVALRLASYVGSQSAPIVLRLSVGSSSRLDSVRGRVCTPSAEASNRLTSHGSADASHARPIFARAESMERRKIGTGARRYSNATTSPAKCAARKAADFRPTTSSPSGQTHTYGSTFQTGAPFASHATRPRLHTAGAGTGSRYAVSSHSVRRLAQEVLL